jgi:hypothetical protein
MTITIRPRWSLGRGKTLVLSSWQATPSSDAPFDVERVMSRLEQLAAILPSVPALPVENICDLFEMFTPAFARDPRYPMVRDALDLAIQGVEGGNAVADRCRNRALSLWQSGQSLEALHEIHEAKVNWWHGDTLRGSILMFRFAARIYSQLKLPHAAKQYASVAAAIASASNDPGLSDLIPQAWSEAAVYAYEAGAWMDTTKLISRSRLAHAHFAEHAFDFDAHPHLETEDVHQAFVYAAARSYRPGLLPRLESDLEETGYLDVIRSMSDHIGGELTWNEEQFVALTDEQLVGRPFSDVGQDRMLSFALLGATWEISSRNHRQDVLAAERLAAALQILGTELTASKLLVIETSIKIVVSTQTPLERAKRVRFCPDNDGITAQVYLTPMAAEPAVDDMQKELLVVAVQLFLGVTLNPAEALMAEVEVAFARGLTHKLYSGRPYDEAADLLGDEHYAALQALAAVRLGEGSPCPPTAAELLPSDDPGPNFNEEKERARIEERYEYLPSLLQQTLPRLRSHQPFLELVKTLREEGWLDWQLLLAVHNIALNARMRRAGVQWGDPAAMAVAKRMAREPETATHPPIPLKFFDEALVRDQLRINLLTAVRGFQLDCRLETPPFAGIQAVLKRRYAFATLDSDHKDPFVTKAG